MHVTKILRDISRIYPLIIAKHSQNVPATDPFKHVYNTSSGLSAWVLTYIILAWVIDCLLRAISLIHYVSHISCNMGHSEFCLICIPSGLWPSGCRACIPGKALMPVLQLLHVPTLQLLHVPTLQLLHVCIM